MSKTKNPGLDARHYSAEGRVQRKRTDSIVLGLGAFERISAVEGVTLSRDMKRDLKVIGAERMSGAERTRFITDRYGKK